MSGGSWEFTMANFDKIVGLSDFMEFPERKYFDLYKNSILSKENVILGDATWETKSWYGDSTTFINSSEPWLLRSGIYTYYNNGIFYMYSWDGAGKTNESSFHVTLVP